MMMIYCRRCSKTHLLNVVAAVVATTILLLAFLVGDSRAAAYDGAKKKFVKKQPYRQQQGTASHFLRGEEEWKPKKRHDQRRIQTTNDDCLNAITIVSSTSSLNGTTNGATLDSNVGACGLANNTAPGVWYKLLANSETLTATTCNGNTDYDTKISVFRGSDCNNLDCVNGNDDDDFCGFGFFIPNLDFSVLSSVTWTELGTQEYYILIHGFSSNTGDFTLNINRVPTTNDLCQNAIAISDSASGTTNGATLGNVVIPSCSEQRDNGLGVWYTVTASNEVVTASTCNSDTNFDTQISVFRGGDCNSLVCVDGNDDDGSCGFGFLDPNLDFSVLSSVTWTEPGTQEYYILIHGFGRNTGYFTLNIDRNPISPTNAPVTPAPTFAPTPAPSSAPTSVICVDEEDATNRCATGACLDCVAALMIDRTGSDCQDIESQVCLGFQSCRTFCASCLNELIARHDCRINKDDDFGICPALNCERFFPMSPMPTSPPSAAPSTSPVAAPVPREPDPPEKEGSSTGIIVGVVVGGVAVVLIAAAAATWLLRNRGRKSSNQEGSGPKPPPPVVFDNTEAADTEHHDGSYGGNDTGVAGHQAYGAPPSSSSGTPGNSNQSGYPRPYGPLSSTNQPTNAGGAPPVRFKDQAQTVVAIAEAIPVPLEQDDMQTRVSDMTPTSGQTRQSADPDGERGSQREIR